MRRDGRSENPAGFVRSNGDTQVEASENIFDGTSGNHAALRQDYDVVGKAGRFVKVVRHEDDRHREVAPELRQLGLQPKPSPAIDGGERLIEKHDIGTTSERASDCDALLLATGKFARPAMLKALQMDPREVIQSLGAPYGPRPIGQRFHHIFDRAEMREQRVRLEDQPNSPLPSGYRRAARRIEPDIAIADDRSVGRTVQSGNRA